MNLKHHLDSDGDIRLVTWLSDTGLGVISKLIECSDAKHKKSLRYVSVNCVSPRTPVEDYEVDEICSQLWPGMQFQRARMPGEDSVILLEFDGDRPYEPIP